MNLKPFLFLFLSFLSLTHAHDVITRCHDLGFKAYALQLSLRPDLLKRINSRGDTAIWAAPDAAVQALFGNNTKLQKRQSSAATLSSTATAKAPPPNAKRHEITASYGETLYTYLDDPTFVNLGRGQPGRVVSKYLGNSSSLSDATFEILSGMGAVTKQISGPFAFDKGVIFGVDGFFTLPAAFSTSIQNDGRAEKFYEAVVHADLQDYFDSTPACTVFAPVDLMHYMYYKYEKYEKHEKHHKNMLDVKKYIICGFVGNTPDLYPGVPYKSLAGTPINITYGDDGQKRVNGLEFVKTDIITKNGVLHLIEKPFDFDREASL
ncbi:hypothetical protein K440DRAFT_620854 [Wilcoxina mikolae CBS 423.85]|nr:hypothetical protein K440DRAFT_620854 [Wilcoxina mikolae CBS 423.85]